jgi:hypothetical protein
VAYSCASDSRRRFARCHIAQELVVQVLGLPLSSVIVLIVIPLGIIAYQYYLCWQIKTGRRE